MPSVPDFEHWPRVVQLPIATAAVGALFSLSDVWRYVDQLQGTLPWHDFVIHVIAGTAALAWLGLCYGLLEVQCVQRLGRHGRAVAAAASVGTLEILLALALAVRDHSSRPLRLLLTWPAGLVSLGLALVGGILLSHLWPFRAPDHASSR
ncbi:MAG TPA: hypothetical protein VFS44_09035 [Gemmatimonadaceae bacterium]|nr:hypothetical protein [Gemmatimonadaceae bacterium]